jgi:hypothetical protein
MLVCHTGVTSHQISALDLMLERTVGLPWDWGYQSVSQGLPGLPCDCGFGFPLGAGVGAAGYFLLFSAQSFYFSVLFSYSITSFMIPDAVPLFHSSEYGLSFVTWLFSYMESHKLLIHHLTAEASRLQARLNPVHLESWCSLVCLVETSTTFSPV